MAEKLNAKCSICGKAYAMCCTCDKNNGTSIWKLHCDTAEHYKIFQIIKGYTLGVYDKEEAKKRFDIVDLSDIDDLRDGIKDIIKDIIEGEKVERNITHTSKSSSVDAELPLEVMSLIPDDFVSFDGEVVKAESIDDVEIKDVGVWKFVKWRPKSSKVDGADVKFVGTWEFISKEINEEVAE